MLVRSKMGQMFSHPLLKKFDSLPSFICLPFVLLRKEFAVSKLLFLSSILPSLCSFRRRRHQLPTSLGPVPQVGAPLCQGRDARPAAAHPPGALWHARPAGNVPQGPQDDRAGVPVVFLERGVLFLLVFFVGRRGREGRAKEREEERLRHSEQRGH